MAERVSDFEWRAEGENAELLLYAGDRPSSDRALRSYLRATSLPGVLDPVYTAASESGMGCVAASATHAAPDLASAPARGLLLVAETRDLSPEAATALLSRYLPETRRRLPGLSLAATRRYCEGGAAAAAEDGLLEDEDLALVETQGADPDSLGRRALEAGARDEDHVWFEAKVITALTDASRAEELGLEAGMLVVVARAESGDLGRSAAAAHRDRIADRIRAGEDFGTSVELPAAPAGAGEAADLLAASRASSCFADARAARLLWAVRRALGGRVGGLALRAAWTVGGIREHGGALVHRDGVCIRDNGEVTVSGSSVVVGTGNMRNSAPPFGAPEKGGVWPWEETGLVERVALLGGTGV